MRKTSAFCVGISTLISLLQFFSFRQSPDEYATCYVIFAGASSNFNHLDSIAEKISMETGIKYSNDLVYDGKRRMIVPDTSSDGIYAGSYYPRRYAEERISIEIEGYYKTSFLLDVDSTKKTMAIGTRIFGEKKCGYQSCENEKDCS